jgi:hypothetical protein
MSLRCAVSAQGIKDETLIAWFMNVFLNYLGWRRLE